jgi:hypothetical protein
MLSFAPRLELEDRELGRSPLATLRTVAAGEQSDPLRFYRHVRLLFCVARYGSGYRGEPSKAVESSAPLATDDPA